MRKHDAYGRLDRFDQRLGKIFGSSSAFRRPGKERKETASARKLNFQAMFPE
jgi:hypothetical protein